MSTDITPYRAASLDEKRRYVETLASAADLIPKGLWANVRNEQGIMVNAPSPGKILLVAETGAMLGLHPMAALQGIDVIEGKATISPQLMTGLLRAAGHKVRIKTSGTVTGGDYSVTVTLIRSDDPDEPFESTWDIDRAVRAGLCAYSLDTATGKWSVKARSQSGRPLPWENYPETMCKWRAIAELGREGGDDVLKGISYTPEEMGAVVTEDGDLETVGVEPSEDWAASILATDSKEAITAVVDRAKESGEFTDVVRTQALTRYGMLNRAPEEVVEGELEETAAESEEEKYERESAAEYDAAQAVTDA